MALEEVTKGVQSTPCAAHRGYKDGKPQVVTRDAQVPMHQAVPKEVVGPPSLEDFQNSARQGTDRLAAALQPALLGAGGGEVGLETSELLFHQNPSVTYLYDFRIK